MDAGDAAADEPHELAGPKWDADWTLLVFAANDVTDPALARAFDEDIAEELRARAKDALLTQAIASEEQLGANEPAEDLLTMDGMDRHLAYILASREIVTMEDLAEQSIDDLIDIDGMDEAKTGGLIMTARAPWFAESEE